MPIYQITPESSILNELKRQLEVKEELLIRVLIRVGEEAVNRARELNTYQDQTGNLRSSIGYIIVKDGRLYKQGDFNTVKQGKDGSTGGIEYAKSLIRKFPKGLVLIVVAGMKYAEHVEAKSYDVISGQELYAKNRVSQLLKKL